MQDITHKSTTLRTAVAEASVVVSKKETIDAVVNRTVPKGDVFEMAKAAGLLGVKKTPDLLPDCHPMPIESTSIRYEIEDLTIKIFIEVKAIYRTGVEVEAMHGASVVALTMYDMLKPIDKGIEIRSIKLLSKTGGKSNYKEEFSKTLQAAVIVCSDTISAGQKEDKAGKMIQVKLEAMGVQTREYKVIPDEEEVIQKTLIARCEAGDDLVLFCGGTGLSARDVTPESIAPLLDREIPGIAERARSYGQERMPYAMLSRGIVGLRGETLVIALPGSMGGAAETMDGIFPHALHVFKVMNKGFRHETKPIK